MVIVLYLTMGGIVAVVLLWWKYRTGYKVNQAAEEYRPSEGKNNLSSTHNTLICLKAKQLQESTIQAQDSSFIFEVGSPDQILIDEIDETLSEMINENKSSLLPLMEESDEEHINTYPDKNDMQYFSV